MSRVPQVKNRAPAAIQITAEQLLREANDRGIETVNKAPDQFITDKDELLQYQHTKRKDFEDQIRRNGHNIGIWCKYALWEASQKEFERARSVFERALDVDYRNQTIWMKYTEMEMKHKFINHARNVWDRCVTLHPRVDAFWYKYSYMEEMVGAVEQARQIFERWMKWEPDDMAWAAFIKFEVRQGEIERARTVYERYVALLPTCRAYLKYARWEESQRQRGNARRIYERSLEELHPFERTEKLLVNFARFEERCKEFDRARVIYQYALTQAASASAAASTTTAGSVTTVKTTDITSLLREEQRGEHLSELKKEFIAFEKRHGSRAGIEDAIIGNRREEYEKAVAADRFNYDAWFDYIRLEEEAAAGNNNSNSNNVRAIYERAVANIPPIVEKRYWKRYIYLWIHYAIYEELHQRDVAATREVYRRCIEEVVPHKAFTFGKIWMLAAQFEVRQKDLSAARKLLGRGIGMCGKENIFKGYIELEHQLGEVERCRLIYAKYLETMPHNSRAWIAFAALEASVGEASRARALYEIAISQAELDMPEALWKAFIDFELAEGETDRARDLYTRLLQRSNHVKVWISFARFEAEIGAGAGSGAGAALIQKGDKEAEKETEAEGESDLAFVSRFTEAPHVCAARDLFQRGYETLKSQGYKEERLMLLEAWRDVEADTVRAARESFSASQEEDDALNAALESHLKAVESKFPRKVKMRRETAVSGAEMEEYYDYIFPDDEKKIVGMKLLEQAMKWKQAAAAATGLPSAPVQGGIGGDGDEEAEGGDGSSQEDSPSKGSNTAGDEAVQVEEEEEDPLRVSIDTLLGKRKGP